MCLLPYSSVSDAPMVVENKNLINSRCHWRFLVIRWPQEALLCAAQTSFGSALRLSYIGTYWLKKDPDHDWGFVWPSWRLKGIIRVFFPKCWSYSVEGVDEGGWPQQPKVFFSQNCLTCKCQPFKVDPAASRYFCEQLASTLSDIPISPLT